jgi:hypothetical protein
MEVGRLLQGAAVLGAASCALAVALQYCGVAGEAASTQQQQRSSKQGKSGELLPDSLNKAIPETIAKAQQQLKELTRQARDASQPPPPEPPPYDVGLPRRRRLTDKERAAYSRDGFVLCKGWFSREEVDILSRVVQEDHQIDAQKIAVRDAEGRDTKLTLWWYLGDDTYGQVGRSASLVGAVSELMQGSEPYHSHSKVLLKEPRSGGAWEWHQDFGCTSLCPCPVAWTHPD